MTPTNTPLAPPAGASFLEQLPAELIENILLEVVSEVEGPNVHEQGARQIRCVQEIHSRASLSTGLLEHRLVCRTLRKCSWRAFALVVGETLFDIRSRKSIENLQALSHCGEVAPWVQKLTFCCLTVSETYPAPSHDPYRDERRNMSKDDRSAFMSIQEKDETWFPTAWTWISSNNATSDLDNEDADLTIDKDTTQLVHAVSGNLLSFQNLRHLKFEHVENFIPARYKFLARTRKHGPAPDFTVGSGVHTSRGAYIGLHVLLASLKEAQLKPKVLSLAVAMDDPHNFMTSHHLRDLYRVFEQVERLTLIKAYEVNTAYWDSVGRPMFITKSALPALRFLTIIANLYARDEIWPLEPFPPASDVPELVNLTMEEWLPNNKVFLDFLNLFKNKVQSITLQEMMEPLYEPVLSLLQTFNLDTLNIREGYESGWERGLETFDEDTNLPKSLLEAAARSVILGPPRFVHLLEAAWASEEGDDGASDTTTD